MWFSFHPFIMYWSHFVSFPVTLPLPHFLSCFLWNTKAWNLNICSANARVRLLIWSLCCEEEEQGAEVPWEEDEKHAGSLRMTNPSDDALSAVSRPSWLIWSYCSNLGLLTERGKNLSHVREGAWWLPGIQLTSDWIPLMFLGVKKQQVIVLFYKGLY